MTTFNISFGNSNVLGDKSQEYTNTKKKRKLAWFLRKVVKLQEKMTSGISVDKSKKYTNQKIIALEFMENLPEFIIGLLHLIKQGCLFSIKRESEI